MFFKQDSQEKRGHKIGFILHKSNRRGVYFKLSLYIMNVTSITVLTAIALLSIFLIFLLYVLIRKWSRGKLQHKTNRYWPFKHEIAVCYVNSSFIV